MEFFCKEEGQQRRLSSNNTTGNITSANTQEQGLQPPVQRRQDPHRKSPPIMEIPKETSPLQERNSRSQDAKATERRDCDQKNYYNLRLKIFETRFGKAKALRQGAKGTSSR